MIYYYVFTGGWNLQTAPLDEPVPDEPAVVPVVEEEPVVLVFPEPVSVGEEPKAKE